MLYTIEFQDCRLYTHKFPMLEQIKKDILSKGFLWKQYVWISMETMSKDFYGNHQ